ncbi:MAG: mechanosensitive ion channel domain-containing protein [Candidatus Sumerlaeaceae bacterium]
MTVRRAQTLVTIFCFAMYVVGAAGPKPTTPSRRATSDKAPLLTAPLELRRETVVARLTALSDATSIPSALRDWTSATLAQAADALAQAESLEAEKASYESEVSSVTSRTEELRQKLQKLAESHALDVPTSATSAQIAQWLAQKEAEVAEREKALQSLEAELNAREQRRLAIPKEIAQARQQLEKIEAGQLVPPAPDASPDWETLRSAAKNALTLALQKKIQTLEAELKMLDSTRDFFDLRHEEAQKLLAASKNDLVSLQRAAAEARQREAQEAIQQARRARWEAARMHPALKEIAEDNETLARRRASENGVPARIAAVSAELEVTKQMRARIQSSFEAVRKRLEILGKTAVVGQLMRKERDDLPSPHELSRQLKRYMAEISQVQAELMDAREKRSQLPALESRLRTQLALDARMTTEDVAQVVSAMIQQRRTLLDALITDLDELFNKLTEITTTYALLIQEVTQYATFLEEHILWIRSARPFSLSEIRRAAEALAFLTGHATLQRVFLTVSGDIVSHWVLYLGVFAALAAGTIWKRRKRHHLADLFPREQPHTLLLGSSHASQILFLLLADALIPWVLVLTFIGYRLLEATQGSTLTDAVANGLIRISLLVFLTNLGSRLALLTVSLTGQSAWHRLRRAIMLLGGLSTLLFFVFVLAREACPRVLGDSLERVVFLLTMTAWALAFFWLFVQKSVCEAVLGQLIGPRYSRILPYLATAGFLILVALGVLSALGFHYSALQILARLAKSLAIIAIVFMSIYLLEVWLQRLLRTHTLPHFLPASGQRQESSDPANVAHSRDTKDSHALVAQVRRMGRAVAWTLIAILLWFTWSDMLPALAFITRIPLWERGEVVAGAPAAVTLGDALLALLVATITGVLLRNISSLVELLLLRSTHLDQGTRYAIAAVVRYAILISGVIAASRSLGLTWKSVQWLAAAVTVGLGFGLQEIFANFVSGLILLFERPVRVGDWITVSGTTGVVTHIRTRATTIRDADGKELLVPNKLLITGAVVNWTLSNTGTRLSFDIRTTPAADERTVRIVLREIVEKEPRISAHPAPTVLLDGLSNTEQRFRLFVYTNRIENREAVKDSVLRAIRQRFAESEIDLLLLDCQL